MQERNNKGKYLKIMCPRCKKLHLIYGKSSSLLKCEKCGYLLAKTTGGKTKIKAPVKEII